MKTKNFFAALLVMAMLFSILPATVSADEKTATFTVVDGSSLTGNENCYKLLDGYTGTKWCQSISESDLYVVIKASEKIVLNGYSFTTGNDTAKYSGRNPKDWVIYGSNDYSESSKSGTWNIICTVTDDNTMGAANYTKYDFTISNNRNAYQYYKLNITATRGLDLMQISELGVSYSTLYDITFDPNYTGSETTIKKSDEAFPDSPERNGYYFMGWYTKDGTDGDWGDEFIDFSEVIGDITVYAKWKKIYYVSFDLNGGTFESKIEKIEHGTDIPNVIPTNGNLKFGGWYTKNGTDGDWGEVYSTDMVLDRDITVYAKWNTVNISFDKNGGISDAIPNITSCGEDFPSVNPTRIGYKFGGWYTKDGTDDDWGEAFTKEMSAAATTDTTVWAKWIPVEITFDINGGDTEGYPKKFGWYEVPEEPEKNGFTFGGWYTENGTNGVWGEEYNSYYNPTEDVTVYAKWFVEGSECVSGTILTALSGTSGNGGENYDKLVDGKKIPGNHTKWCVSNFSSAYVILESSEYTIVKNYTLTTANDTADNPGRNPKDWVLYGCNDYDKTIASSGTWEVISSVTGDSTMEAKNYTDYTFKTDNTKAYKYYKFEISAIQSGTVMQLAELEFDSVGCEHDWGTSAHSAADCTNPERDLYTCKVCGLQHEVLSGEMLGHVCDENGICKSCNLKSIASLGDKWYFDMQSAINDAQINGDTVKLNTDVQIKDTVNISGTATLDLKGYTLTMTDSGSVVNIERGATFTLKDTSVDKSEKITGGNSTLGGGVCNYGTFNMEGGTITGCSATEVGGGIYSGSNSSYEATVNITGGSISDNTAADKGGAMYISKQSSESKKSELNIENAEVKNNKVTKTGSTGGGIGIFLYAQANVGENTVIEGNSAYSGGGIHAENYATLTMNGGIVKGNYTNGGNGGGICVIINSTAEINNTEILNNKSLYNDYQGKGGGIAAQKNGTVTLNNATVSENVAADGGGVYVNLSTVNINGGKINNNKTKKNTVNNWGSGAAVYVDYDYDRTWKNSSDVTVDGTEMSENKSERSGGAVFVSHENANYESAKITIKNSNIKSNTAAESGGGIYVEKGATAVLQNTAINANTAAENGHGIAINEATAEIGGETVISANGTASGNVNGGGIWISESTVDIKEGVEIKENIAENGGGIYLQKDAILGLKGGTISENKATAQGGGIYCDTDNLKVDGYVVISDNGIFETSDALIQNNLYIASGKTITVVSASVPKEDNSEETNDSRIYVTLANGKGDISNLSEIDCGKYFISDNEKYKVKDDEGILKLIGVYDLYSFDGTKIKLSSKDLSAKVYVAVYNGKTLTDVKSCAVTAEDMTITIAETGIDTSGADRIAVFMWDKDMKPLCENVSDDIR